MSAHAGSQHSRYDLPLILSFDALDKDALPAVGGKGANLGILARAGFPVPPGFCVTTRAYDLFMETGGLGASLWPLLEALDPRSVEALRETGAQVRARVETTPLPEALCAAIQTAWGELDPACAYAVRSSATAEDLPGFSFAGQQDTYLNVVGIDALLDAVRRCFASLFTDRAIQYRVQNGFTHRDVRLSVVIQKMVQPDVSGVMFTVDPVSGHRLRLVIEATPGLGEALVSGQVTPDRYLLSRADLSELETGISPRTVAIRSLQGGGTYKETLATPAPPQRALPAGVTRALADLGLKIEAHYGEPQDIEWCWEAGTLYIVQSRPITSLFPLPAPLGPESAARVYICFNHLQVMTDAMTPLAGDVLRFLLPFGRDDYTQPNAFTRMVGGRLYIDVSHLLTHPLGKRLVPLLMTQADATTAAAMTVIRDRFASMGDKAPPPARNSKFFDWFAPILAHTLLNLLWYDPAGSKKRLDDHVDLRLKGCREMLAQATTDLSKARTAFQHTLSPQLFQAFRKIMPIIASGIQSGILLKHLMHGKVPDSDIEALSRGFDGNVTTEMDLAVGDVADVARPYPELVQAIKQVAAGNQPLQSLDGYPGGAAFLAALNAFLEQYGMRGNSEIDASRPRWNDDPRGLLQVMSGNLAGGELGGHRKHFQQLKLRAAEAASRVTEAAGAGLLGPLRRRLVARLIRVHRFNMALRESPKFFMIKLFWMVRQTMLEIGEHLVRAGRLDRKEDIWMFTSAQLFEGLEQPTKDLRTTVQEERARLERYRRMQPPRIFTGEGEIPVGRSTRGPLPPGTVAGTAASSGVVEGTVKVVLDPTRDTLEQGQILVAPFTDPGWTPLFINARGLVMEVGGMMTHGSVVAREYGIPAVVGVANATQIFKTGQRIRVDGSQGLVTALSAQERTNTDAPGQKEHQS